MDFNNELSQALVHVARLALTGRPQDVHAQIRQSVRRLRKHDQQLARVLAEMLALSPSVGAPLRDAGAGMVPVDADSRLALVRHEPPTGDGKGPLLSPDVLARVEQIVSERRDLAKLEQLGLPPTRSVLLVGPPGVGKTMCARWIAERLNWPLVTLDLATVMSSYLGKTGANIRAALDYGKSVETVLLLDEFDAVAKRRDDDSDIGELKRLVNVLLQEIDDWPTTSLLIAATNHGELLDPAIWRRFDEVLHFERPNADLRRQLLARLLADEPDAERWIEVLAQLWREQSPSDITRALQWVRRRAAVQGQSFAEPLLERIAAELREATPAQRKQAAEMLVGAGMSDRRVSAVIGISRDTLRRARRAPSAVQQRDE